MNQSKDVSIKTINPSFDNLKNYVEVDVLEYSEKKQITIRHPLDYNIGTISESLGFCKSEENTWIQTINEEYGAVEDYAIEICKVLIHLGFSVAIKNEKIFDRLKNIDFKNEPRNWIRLQTPDTVHINLSSDDKLVAEAIRLPDAKKTHIGVLVPIHHADDILTFANVWGVYIAPSALLMLKGRKTQTT